MRNARFAVLVLAATVALSLAYGQSAPKTEKAPASKTEPAEKPPAGKPAEKPLTLDDEPPLLLDGDEDSPKEKKPGADNSRCLHCHLNFAKEKIAADHAAAKIGCADCHGKSDAHIADESWASGGNGTAPDIMYPHDKINPSCYKCHAKEDLPEKDHKPFFKGTVKEKYCTDCHGEHRMVKRKCKWK